MRGLKLYEVNPNYIKYLAQYQEHIFISDGDKARRKYIGVRFAGVAKYAYHWYNKLYNSEGEVAL